MQTNYTSCRLDRRHFFQYLVQAAPTEGPCGDCRQLPSKALASAAPPPPHSFGRDYRLTGVNTSRQMHPLTMHRPLSLSLSISHSRPTPPPSPELSCQEMRRFCHVRLSISPFNGFVHFLSFSFPFFVGFHSAPVPAGYFHVGYIRSDEVGECRRCESMAAMLRAV